MISGTALFLGLFNNLAIFIILIAAYGFLNSYFEKAGSPKRQTAVGLSFGLFAIACMYVQIPVAEGVIVDQRNAIVALSGAFGGPLSALLCALMTGAFRIYLGGAGVLAGVVGVGLAACSGAGLYALRSKIDTAPKAAFAALAATVVILPGFLLVGDIQTGWTLMKAMALPYGSAIFLGIFLVGLLLAHEESRQVAEVEQKLSEKRFRELFESLIDVSYRTDSNGNFVIISPSSEKLFGYRTEEIVGKPIADFYKEPSRREDFMAQLQRDGRVENFEAEIRKKDGTFVWVSTNAKLLKDATGTFSGVEGVTRDISKLKKVEQEKIQLEEDLRQRQKMEAVGTLAGGIAHDFNNILGAVVGYTELVADRLPEGSPDKEDLEAVLAAAHRGKEMTNQILMFSRKRKPDKELIQAHLVIEEAVRLLKQTIPASVQINLEIDRHTGFLLADPTQIHQIVVNLCTNAYHSLENEKGEIGIQLRPVKADPTILAKHPNLRGKNYALLTVRDNGHGIDRETMSRIFEPFFTTKEQGRGTGMGLSVVHGIVQDHHGAIDVASEPGVGSSFGIFLPLAREERKVPPVPDFKPRYGKENILLIDDESSLVKLGRMVLEKLGYKVFATSSAQEALDKFRADPSAFDLIFTDQTMPEMSGDLLAREAMRIRPNIPVIICTGHSSVLDAEKARAMGVKALLMKPFDQSTLAETLRNVLDDPANSN